MFTEGVSSTAKRLIIDSLVFGYGA